ncbi:efflux RND transporter periplasmic adaptor subunit [Cecembia calidifontis]|uniref:Multidrug efflux pump subunit AcrA (Membrane-fusion protein) n=1 Tax=Cecembia calidifontis TaxID=1187080 RepID=A0A4Q7PEW8_9BACT|nr:efflux RND transporter periplasmic adaptor subunit [Cecembia calidifontis]RZS98210.1 multidrug efflux pump subunit AcrA (membrane-fusion protein) [Cecembia calidifontis]
MRLQVPALFFLILFQFSCGQKEETVYPQKENISESVFASGLIKAKDQYRAFANTSGILKEIYVKEGDRVNSGDVILEITNETARLNRETAELVRAYADRRENLAKLKDMEINIELAKSRYENDSILLERQKKLWAQGIGKAVDLEQRELGFQNSKTLFNSSKLRYEDLKREIDFNEKNASKSLALSKSLESDLFLKSKVNGKVYALLVEKGEMVNPQTPLAIIGNEDEFLLEMQVDEYDIVKVKIGQKIMVTMDSYRGEVFEAKVTKINPIMDERNKSFTVEGEFVKRPETLYPNLNFEANILIQSKENVLTIPRAFLLKEKFVIGSRGDTIPVETGIKGFQKVEILSGIDESTQLKKP